MHQAGPGHMPGSTASLCSAVSDPYPSRFLVPPYLGTRTGRCAIPALPGTCLWSGCTLATRVGFTADLGAERYINLICMAPAGHVGLRRAWRLGPPCTMDGDDPPAGVLSPGPMRHPPPAGAFGPGSLKRAAAAHRSLCVGPVPGSATDAAVPPEQMPCQGAPARPWNRSPTRPSPASVPRPPRARIPYQRQDGSFGAWRPCGSRSGKRQSDRNIISQKITCRGTPFTP